MFKLIWNHRLSWFLQSRYLIHAAQYIEIPNRWNQIPTLNKALTYYLIQNLNYYETFTDCNNSAAFDRVLHNLYISIICRLELPDYMGSNLYNILHGIKYQVFTLYEISKLKYSGHAETLSSSGQDGCHYLLVFDSNMDVSLGAIGKKMFPH